MTDKKNRALYLVQGVSDGLYIDRAVHEDIFPIHLYDSVKTCCSEDIFDKGLSLSKKLSFADRHSDWIRFSCDKNLRKNLRDQITHDINFLYLEHKKVDVLAHSLGTWMMLGTNIYVDNCFLFGSPCGFAGFLSSMIIDKELKSLKGSGLRSRNLANIYGDWIGMHDLKDWLVDRTTTNYNKFRTHSRDHQLSEMIKTLPKDHYEHMITKI